MPTTTARAQPRMDAVSLDEVLREISRETGRLAEQCGVIQWSISAMLEVVDHPDLGAEIHMLQDIDRIQQTLADIAAILEVTGKSTGDVSVERDEIVASIRLESLRQRLGLCGEVSQEPGPADLSDITWL